MNIESLPPEESWVNISPEILYFGTPVAILSTLNPDGSTNLAAMSSFWALGDRFVIGLALAGRTGSNLLVTDECVINLPSPAQWEMVERLGHTTGRLDMPDYKKDAGFVYAADKFALSGFSPLASKWVRPLRAAQCPGQIETQVVARHRGAGVAENNFSMWNCRSCWCMPIPACWMKAAGASISMRGRP